MIFQHSRFQIWGKNQHPYAHSLSDFLYTNSALPTGVVTDLQGAMDWLFAVIYPKTQPAVATTAALPTVGNTLNDYRVVQDDGDGKAAAYRWEKREGEAVASWHKIYDMDWGSDSILQAFLGKTQDIYVKQWGYDDLDAAGTPIAGVLAGQRIYGGATAGTHLTLYANSGDGTGASTGFVQFGDAPRPTADNTFDVGTTALRWKKAWLNSAQVSTLLLGAGSITDSSGAITFGSSNLTTTGFVKSGTLTVSGGSIIDTGGNITFGGSSLTTTGNVTGFAFFAPINASQLAAGTIIGDTNYYNNGIVSNSGNLSFGGNSFTNVSTIALTTLTGTTVNGGNLTLAGNTLSSTNVNGNIILLPNGTGSIAAQKAMTTLGITATGNISATGNVDGGSLRLSSNILSATTANTDIKLTPTGSGALLLSAITRPDSDNVFTLGSSASRWSTLYVATGISDGTTTVSSSTLQSFRDANVAVSAGMTLFWNGTKWVPSLPDTEINHGTISGLSADDHTQYALLAGRVGGQTFTGGTASGDNLVLESTSNVNKGSVLLQSTLSPFVNASFSSTWSGVDIGGTSTKFRHFYSAGEFFGLRLENVGSLPSASTQNKGRLVFLTTDSSPYVDTGTALKRITLNKFSSDTVWNGTDLTKTVTVSANITDARTALWQLCDNTNNFERVYCSLKAISATQITITTGSALPAGSYRLIGIE